MRIFLHFNLLDAFRCVLYLDSGGLGNKRVQRKGQWWCEEGMRECLVSQNSAKLEVNGIFVDRPVFLILGCSVRNLIPQCD